MVDAYVRNIRVGAIVINTLLDSPDGCGHNCYNNKVGRHMGICQKHGVYFLIRSNSWQGDNGRAIAVDKDSALDAVLLAGATDVLPIFPELESLLTDRLERSIKVMRRGAIS